LKKASRAASVWRVGWDFHAAPCANGAVNLLPEVRDCVGCSHNHSPCSVSRVWRSLISRSLRTHFLAFILSFGKFWRAWQKSLQDTARAMAKSTRAISRSGEAVLLTINFSGLLSETPGVTDVSDMFESRPKNDL
jgi:hypothetical protein